MSLKESRLPSLRDKLEAQAAAEAKKKPLTEKVEDNKENKKKSK